MISSHLAALALLEEPRAPLSPKQSAAIIGIHIFGLAAVFRYFHQPLWFALPTLLLLLVCPIVAMRSSRALAVETLAPLFFLYVVLLARVIAIRVLFANVPYQDEASLADPRLVVFQVEVTAIAALVYIALVQITCLARGVAKTRALIALSLLLLGFALTWFAVETIGHRTRGATATDPYAYAQMAVDLATRGTPLHKFDMFQHVANLPVAWYPVEHIGYRLINNLAGDAPTVWPIGGSIAMAFAYRLLGEEGLYLTTPLAALASLVAFVFLVWEYSREKSNVERAALAAISVVILATSWEQVDRSIVPLVDAQAQLFSILTILFALRAARSNRIWSWGILTGFALGAAYFVRHTQVLLAVPIVIAAWQMPTRDRIKLIAVAALSAFVVALPDLYYHQLYFGGWLKPESEELALFSVSNLFPSAVALGERFFAGNEFGYLVLFVIYGIFRAARDDVRKFAVIASWALLLIFFHLFYAAVKMRDMLPEFPAVILITAFGMISLARDLRDWASRHVIASRSPERSVGVAKQSQTQRVEIASSHKTLLAMTRKVAVALAIFLALLLPGMRTRLTILRPFQPVKITFGYVTEYQRSSFDRIADLTTNDAVIGSTMNDGPIDLYSKRNTFRPGVWNSSERTTFVDAMLRATRPIYLLEDGAEMSAARRDLSSRYTLRQIAVLDVPIFGNVDGTPGTLWELTNR